MKIRISLLLIFLIAIFLRLWRLEELFYFMMDEAVVAFRGWGLFALKRFFLIGGISPLGFHMPPYFYWFSGIFLPFLNFYPLIWGYLGILIALLTIYFLYLLVKKLTNQKTALISTWLYSLSFTAVFFDRHYWPLVFNPLLVVLTIWLLITDSKYKWLFLAFLAVFGVTADPSNLTILILIIYVLFKRAVFKEKLTFFLIFFALFLTPLVIFDLRHGGSNLQGVKNFLNKTEKNNLNILKIRETFLLPARVFSRFWYSPQTDIALIHTYCSKPALWRQQGQPLLLQLIAFIFLLTYWLKKRQEKGGEVYFCWLLEIYLFGLLIYGVVFNRPLFDHYLAGLLPIFAFITAKFLVRFWVFGMFFLFFLTAFNLRQFFLASNPYGLEISLKAVNWTIIELKEEEFALDVISSCFRYNGLRYLYEIKNKPPALSFIDPQFFWLYKEKPKNYFPEKLVIFTDEEPKLDLKILKKAKFGNWWVLIVDNSNRNYQIEGL